jgi:hypothetical protein
MRKADDVAFGYAFGKALTPPRAPISVDIRV